MSRHTRDAVTDLWRRRGGFREAHRTFRPALQGLRGSIATAFGLTVLAIGVQLLQPWPAKFIVDDVLVAGGVDRPTPAVGLQIALAAAAAAFIPFVAGRLTYWATVVSATIARTATTRVRRQLFEHIHRLALPFHTSSRTGDLLVRMTGDVNLVRDMLFASWVNLAGRALLVVGITVVLVIVDPLVAGAALIPLPLTWFLVSQRSRELKRAVKKQRRRQGDLAAFAGESLAQIEVVKAYAAESIAVERFDSSSQSGEKAGLKAAKIAARMQLSTEQLTGLGGGLVLFVAALQAITGNMTIGELLVAVSYSRSLYKPLRKMSSEVARISKASAVAGRLVEVMRVEPESAGGEPAPRFTGDIAFKDVSFSYHGGPRVLDRAHFFIPAGELAVLVGPNGSGKSTALGLLLRLLNPGSGEITIDGQRIDRYQLAGYRNRIAYVPQDLRLFSGTVRDNIRYGRLDATDAEVEAAARLAYFEPVVWRLANGYETELGEGGETLSGGEARRLMLARAALRDADLLLFDEPLAGLDPETAPEIAAAVRSIARGRTALVVTHHSVADLDPDMVLHLVDGYVVRSQPLAPIDSGLGAVEPPTQASRLRGGAGA